ncbi:MAG TPA: lactonase family protein [Bryobacteraceae bacterium]
MQTLSSVRVSRRSFVTAASSLLASSTLAGARQSRASNRPVLACVGTYSSPQGPEGSKGRGQGIYLFEMNAETGALTQREVFADAFNPAWLALDTSRSHLYAAEETNTFNGTHSGSVSAISVDRSNGHLTLLNRVSSEGAGPAHLSIHPSGKFVLVANYAGGTVAVLPIDSNGQVGPATDVKTDQGETGSIHAASAPSGSFAISGHDRPHAHMIHADPSGRFVLAADLGLDRMYVWRFDADSGKLSPNDPPFVSLPSGDGPRHFAFHPSGRWVYALQEESSTLVTFAWDGVKGTLQPMQTLSTLPKGFSGTNFTSEVTISPDARFLYAANRLHDSIAFFSIGPDGRLTYAGEEWTRGDYPRSFNIDPSGRFLYSCNQRSDAVTCFRVNRRTGQLTFTGQYTPVGTPGIIVFLT